MASAASLVRRARQGAGLSQRALAAAAGLHQSAVARVETGRVQPALPTLERLLHACGYQLDLDLVPAADPHDLSLLSTTLPLTYEERVDRLVALNRTARDLREAVRRAHTQLG